MAEQADPEILEYEIFEEDTARPVEPITFFGPHGSPPADRDFRPTIIQTFSGDGDEVVEEDGHGHFSSDQGATNRIVHPSEPRRRRPYEGEAPEPTDNTDNEAERKPGIAVPKQGQSSET